MKVSEFFDPIEDSLAAIAAGEIVIMTDASDRENEGDVVVAAQKITAEQVAFFMNHCRGLLCVSISKETSLRLQLPYQTDHNQSPFHTPFTVSIDHRDVVGNGASAESRAFTIRRLADPNSTADEFVSPGYVFPLIANEAGVLGRRGQTEGSYDIARLAGLESAGAICEILAPDGTMLRGQQLKDFSVMHKLPLTSVEAVLKYRVSQESFVRESVQATLQTDFGEFETHVFKDDVSGKEHLALTYGDLTKVDSPLLRVHSECLTGDVFTSRRCDCGPQLAEAAKQIVASGAGIILYLRQEGRGIGLVNKLRAYALQDQGHDTVEANIQLGFGADMRDYRVGASLLNAIGVSRVRLLTNNPDKVETLRSAGIEISERVALITPEDEYSHSYMETKRTKMGHIL